MRLDPLQSVQTQSWNIVYLTYCTGDVHTGNKVAVYDNVDPTQPLSYFHRGAVGDFAIRTSGETKREVGRKRCRMMPHDVVRILHQRQIDFDLGEGLRS